MKFCRFQVLPGFYVFLSFAILLVPLKWLLAWFAAALIHEICHILALKACGCRVELVTIGMSGASIQTDGLSGVKMSLCALAGPLGGFLLLIFLRITPRLALCGVIQSLYNLLPVYPLDGGRVLMGMTERFLSEKTAKKVLNFTENFILLLLVCCSFCATIKLRLGMFPLILVGVLIVRNKKIPCKDSPGRVQ